LIVLQGPLRTLYREDGTEYLLGCTSCTGIEPLERYTKTRFETALQLARESFAEELATKVVGVAPPTHEYWSVSVWNQNDPAKRMNGLAVTDNALPYTLVMREMCDALG
jgi:hypothetical protein